MDNQERKRIRKLGKELVEEKSSALKAAMSQCNPAEFGRDEYIKNEMVIRMKERKLELDVRVRTAKEVESDYVAWQIGVDAQGNIPQSFQDFLQCTVCGDCVPVRGPDTLHCSCGKIAQDSEPLAPLIITGQVKIVRLLGKVSAGTMPHPKKGWACWK